MRRTNVLEAWVEERTAAADGLQTIGPTLYVGHRPVACWLDRADPSGAQIALYGVRMGRPWLQSHINEAVQAVGGTFLRVPSPLPSPTPMQHAENISYLVGAWQRTVATTARSTHYAWGHYQVAQHQAADVKLYAWAFDLPEPQSKVSREVLSRARRNAIANRREKHKKVAEPSRDIMRALWRGGRNLRNAFLGPVMIRLSSDGQTIETSEGEKIPLPDVPVELVWGPSVRLSSPATPGHLAHSLAATANRTMERAGHSRGWINSGRVPSRLLRRDRTLGRYTRRPVVTLVCREVDR